MSTGRGLDAGSKAGNGPGAVRGASGARDDGWEAVIGLEIHVQLNTRTKMFCGCEVTFGEPPNTRVCPVCLGHPGVLPVTNEKALEYATRIALDTVGRNFPNIPMLGALLKAVDIVSKDGIRNEIRNRLGARVSTDVAEANIKAFERAYNETKEG